jgi:hypothetical protein
MLWRGGGGAGEAATIHQVRLFLVKWAPMDGNWTIKSFCRS